MNDTVEIKGATYQIGRMPPITQFHISRRLGPMLAVLGISLSQLENGAKKTVLDFAPMLGPVMDIMSKMSNEDSEFIIFTCLAVVKRDQGEGRFAPITKGTAMMFDDIDMPAMLRLVVEVLRTNLGGFLQGLGDEVTLPSS